MTAHESAEWIARLALGTPVLTRTKLLRILGRDVVEAIEIDRDGELQTLPCDSVILTGQFIPEAALLAGSHLDIDEGSGGPVIDQHWRCSDPCYFAAGNLLRPVETSGIVGREGEAAGRAIAAALSGRLPEPVRRVSVRLSSPLRYITPQVVAIPGDRLNGLQCRGRVTRPARGTLKLLRNGKELWRHEVSLWPEQRIRLPGQRISLDALEALEVRLDEPPV